MDCSARRRFLGLYALVKQEQYQSARPSRRLRSVVPFRLRYPELSSGLLRVHQAELSPAHCTRTTLTIEGRRTASCRPKRGLRIYGPRLSRYGGYQHTYPVLAAIVQAVRKGRNSD